MMPKDMHVAMRIRGELDKYAGSYKITQKPSKDNQKETDTIQEY